MALTQSESLIGASVRRMEDPRLLAGRARYLDDIELPGMLEAAVLRSPYAHARIKNIDISRALEYPGVFDVLTGAEIVDQVNPQPVIWHPAPGQRMPERYAMAVDKVRWVGEPVAVVAAINRYVAEDALELIDVDYEALPVLADLDSALAAGAPPLYEDWPDNVSGSVSYSNGDIDKAFNEADVVVSLTTDHGRATGSPIEPRGCIATWDSFGPKLELWLSTQSPNLARDLMGEALGIPVHQIRILVPDIGGGFGNKFDFYAEEVIASVLSRKVGRSIKLVEDRQESFVANAHSREQRLEFELAAKSDGTILGLRGTATGVLGGAMATVGMGPIWLTTILATGPYKIPNIHLTGKSVVTNRSPYGSYRGWGQPQANLVHERLIELLASKLNLDRNEIRKKNFPEPHEFPFFNGSALTYDSGRYANCVDLALEKVEENGWWERQKGARLDGRSVGIGFSFHVEVTAFGPSKILNLVGLHHAGFDEEVVRMDSTGKVTVYSGQTELGQGVQTTLAQVAAEGLGIQLQDVNVVVGDTDACPYTGYGTGASRAAPVSGAAVMIASSRLREKVLRIAGEILEAAPEDLEIEEGVISVKGVPDRFITTAEVGDAAYRRLHEKMPEGETPTLEEVEVFDPDNFAIPYGMTAIMVEVDRETGVVTLIDYLQAHDCGTIINPAIVDGQLAGGATQALGGSILEELVYDDEGQLLTGSFMDYRLPTASDIPRFSLYHQTTPSPVIPGGMKGVGEAGTIGAVAAVGNAVDDALADIGVTVKRFPVTPPRLLDQIKRAGIKG